jgi:hypothetical protein
MSSHAFAVLLYVLLALTGVVLEVLSRTSESRVPPLGVLLGNVMRTRSGRVGMLAAWLWVGLHFFAR